MPGEPLQPRSWDLSVSSSASSGRTGLGSDGLGLTIHYRGLNNGFWGVVYYKYNKEPPR